MLKKIIMLKRYINMGEHIKLFSIFNQDKLKKRHF